MPECPHCRQTLDPLPSQLRKCPHCRLPIVVRRGQLFTPEAAAKLNAKLVAEQAQERFREGRRDAAREIREARKSGVVTGFKPLVSSNKCKETHWKLGSSCRGWGLSRCRLGVLVPLSCQLAALDGTAATNHGGLFGQRECRDGGAGLGEAARRAVSGRSPKTPGSR